ncbi:MAG: hypothetical protein LLG14_12930 [Nocardiaceae bacterium]|nr:hypothetical protein [Nocardiaceae bacterium]
MTYVDSGIGADNSREHEQARRFHVTLIDQLRRTRAELQAARTAAKASADAVSGDGMFRVAKLAREVVELRHMLARIHSRFPTLGTGDKK